MICPQCGTESRAEQMDPEDVRALLAPYHAYLREVLERWGGTVEKFIGDAVMALFGAPVAHEDDPERAVRAALAIREWAREEGIELRVGINTGEALITIGAEPLAAGDVVNTGARLQTAAPVNGILVGETTYRATRHVIDYREAEPVDAKGKTEAVPVWQAIDARSRFGVDVRQHGAAPLVGRERELDALVSTLERVKEERTPQLVTLVGVPGIGKSRLVYELFQTIERGDTLTFWRQGRSLPYGEGVSFWALSEMVKAQAGIREDEAADAVADRLRRAVRQLVPENDADWVESHLRPLAGLGAQERLSVRRMAPLLRGDGRTPSARPRLRGLALGRRGHARLRRPPGGVGGRRVDAHRRNRATGVARAAADVGRRKAERDDGQPVAVARL